MGIPLHHPFLIGIFHYKPTISAGLLFLLDLGRDAHHAGGSDASEPARTALRADLHVLCTERFRSLVRAFGLPGMVYKQHGKFIGIIQIHWIIGISVGFTWTTLW